VDAKRIETVRDVVEQVRPNVMINCIGVVKQRREALDPILSITINSLFPHQLAACCRRVGCRLIHFSTDCVFSGRKGNYTEDDLSDPPDLYGRSKLLGEVAGPGCLTLRTSIIGRELRNRQSLVEWFIRQRGGEVEGYQRAIYSGLTTHAMARLVGDLIEFHPHLEGLWHVSADPIDKFSLLHLLNEQLKLGIRIKPQTDFRCDRSLDSTRFREAVGFRPPSWPEMIKELAEDSIFYE
jgi:dTDP-4-dehydrorhamnose reductase